MNERQEIANEFNKIIATIPDLSYRKEIDWKDLATTENFITNSLDSKLLTDLILNNYFKQNDSKEYHHFTTIESFESIVKDEKLWLFTVSKRFSEDEFISFYAAHNMTGYETRKNSKGQTLTEEFVGDTFYMSFTNENIQPNALKMMWDYFAENGTGVKLVFEVSDLSTDLRKVFYPLNDKQKALPLIVSGSTGCFRKSISS